MSAVLEVREPGARYLSAPQPLLAREFDLMATAPGGVARLRELILTLAVRGKLVPQDISDEPADVLLQRIKVEKDRLICDGTVRRDKPSPLFDHDQQTFDLPPRWVWCRLGDVAWPQAGFAFKSGGFNEEARGLPLVRIRDVGSAADPTTFFLGEYRPEFVVERDDWLISMDGEFRVRRWHGSKALLNQRVTRLIFFSGTVASEFVAHALQVELSKLQGTKAYTTVDHLSGAQIAEAVIGLPPVEEQSRIVARVEELMRLCDVLEAKGRLEAEQHARLLSTLLGTLTDSTSPDELATNWHRVAAHFDLLLDRPEAVGVLEQTILQLAVRGSLVNQDPTDQAARTLLQKIADVSGNKAGRTTTAAETIDDFRQLFALPQSWAWAQFASVAEIASNLVSPAAHAKAWQVAPDCIEKGTGRLLERRTVAEAGVTSANHQFAPGQILYSKIRPSLSKVVQVDFAGLCSADMYPVNARIDPSYLLLYMLSRAFLMQVSAAENRVKMPKLNQEALNSLLVAVPPLAEQQRIVVRVTQLRRLCTDLRQRLAASQTTQTHLAEALVGSAIA